MRKIWYFRAGSSNSPEKKNSQPMGPTIASSLNGFLVAGSSPVGGLCHLGIMFHRKPLEGSVCHVASCDLTDPEGGVCASATTVSA
jgi:hypothetical protein